MSVKNGVVPGMDFYIEEVKRELFKVKKEVISLRDKYIAKKFKKPEQRLKALTEELINNVINVPIVINIENPPEYYPLHKLTIVFDEIRDKARATYKKDRTHFEDGKILQATIGLKLEIDLENIKNPISVNDLAYSRVPHELTHLYQHYKWKNKVDYEKNRQVMKKELGRVAIWNKQASEEKHITKAEKNNNIAIEFLTNYLSKSIYYFSEKEIGAKVTQTYYELIRENATKKDFFEKLKKTTHWESLQLYMFNLDTFNDLIKHNYTVVIVEKTKRVKMRFSDEDLKKILQDVNKAIDANEEEEEKFINKRIVDIPKVDIPKVDKRTEIFKQYNLNTQNPRNLYIKLLERFEIQMEDFRRRILKLAIQLPDAPKKVIKKKSKQLKINVVETTNIENVLV